MFTGQTVRVILNPTSGTERGRHVTDVISHELQRAGVSDLDVHTTRSGSDAVRWAGEAAADGFGIVIAAGGDGTVTAVAHGVRKAGTDTLIGIVPLGTGNGLARILQVPIDTVGALRALQQGKAVPLDVLDVPSHEATSLLFLGAGLDAEINRDADPEDKARLGFLAYVQATFSNLTDRRNHDITLLLDGNETSLQAHTVSVFNATHLKLLGAQVGPDAYPHDGVAEVAVLTSQGLLQTVGQVLRVVDRNASRPVLRKIRELQLQAEPPMLVHIDGDVVGETPLALRVVPAALRFIAGRDYRLP